MRERRKIREESDKALELDRSGCSFSSLLSSVTLPSLGLGLFMVNNAYLELSRRLGVMRSHLAQGLVYRNCFVNEPEYLGSFWAVN